MPDRHSADQLLAFAHTLLARAGLDDDKARIVAEILLEADLLGHTTHGLALLALYLAEIEKGAMAKTGEPRLLADFPAAVTWDGLRLPGPWLVVRALETWSRAAGGQCARQPCGYRGHARDRRACRIAMLRRIGGHGECAPWNHRHVGGKQPGRRQRRNRRLFRRRSELRRHKQHRLRHRRRRRRQQLQRH